MLVQMISILAFAALRGGGGSAPCGYDKASMGHMSSHKESTRVSTRDLLGRERRGTRRDGMVRGSCESKRVYLLACRQPWPRLQQLRHGWCRDGPHSLHIHKEYFMIKIAAPVPNVCKHFVQDIITGKRCYGSGSAFASNKNQDPDPY